MDVDITKNNAHLECIRCGECKNICTTNAISSSFRVGGVPPLGYPERLPALLDENLFRYPVVWAAAGTNHAFFPVAPERLLAMTGGTRTALKKETAER